MVTNSVEASVYYYIQLEKACQIQMMADCAAAARGETTVKISPEQAEVTAKTIGDASTVGWFAGTLEFDLLEHQERKKFDFGKK